MKWIQIGCWLGLGLLLSNVQLRVNFSRHSQLEPTPALRLMGPASELGRSIQWIRFQRASLRGDQPRALALAESAIAFDPASTDGWQLLAAHLGYLLASPEREHDLVRRRQWFEAGLLITRRGAEQARHPEEMHLQRGLMLISKIELDPELDPEGPEGLLRRAKLALSEAKTLGSKAAAEMLELLALPEN